MGFFKKLFKRKKGGTMFGNLLRGAASAATGGVLGSGAGLAAWEAKQENSDPANALRTFNLTGSMPAQGNNGRQIGRDLLNNVIIPNTGNGTQTNSTMGASIMTAQMKKKWYIPVGIILLVISATYFIVNGRKGKKGRRAY
jgi:hypothetical protein